MVDTDWHAIALAALRTEFPRLPDALPDGIAALVPVIADRMSTAGPGITSQMVGAYSVVYAAGGGALPLTAMEVALLRPYRRPRYAVVRTPTAVATEAATLDAINLLGEETADYLGVNDGD